MQWTTSTMKTWISRKWVNLILRITTPAVIIRPRRSSVNKTVLVTKGSLWNLSRAHLNHLLSPLWGNLSRAYPFRRQHKISINRLLNSIMRIKLHNNNLSVISSPWQFPCNSHLSLKTWSSNSKWVQAPTTKMNEEEGEKSDRSILLPEHHPGNRPVWELILWMVVRNRALRLYPHNKCSQV